MNMVIDSLVIRFVTLGNEQYLRLAEDKWYYFKSPEGDWSRLGPFLSTQLEQMYQDKLEAGYKE